MISRWGHGGQRAAVGLQGVKTWRRRGGTARARRTSGVGTTWCSTCPAIGITDGRRTVAVAAHDGSERTTNANGPIHARRSMGGREIGRETTTDGERVETNTTETVIGDGSRVPACLICILTTVLAGHTQI